MLEVSQEALSTCVGKLSHLLWCTRHIPVFVSGILFKMALAETDTHGLYLDAAGRPSDEFAAKAAGVLV